MKVKCDSNWKYNDYENGYSLELLIDSELDNYVDTSDESNQWISDAHNTNLALGRLIDILVDKHILDESDVNKILEGLITVKFIELDE